MPSPRINDANSINLTVNLKLNGPRIFEAGRKLNGRILG